ncbi:endonuclease domain-containing protein [Gracilimonas mengyeensis]|uniref:Very-short-patch-repair endonuclease n=1 Tax=Gracilimonas mengyeensis TaxID=1302730 RepID=A0A521BFI5_9BACT|nr:endonuclease domain-containing protein [Gracilimonas mengyeensis]SMO45868.1 Very-short-patch-repair endonuclease [Gracilimonas mengyeensis]
MSIKNPRKTLQQRRKLRQDMTEAEEILWEALRRKTLGVRVKRQYGVGPYILDFYIPKVKLAIEVDGKIHLKKVVQEKDLNRDVFLTRNGIEVIRFKNEEVLNNLENVVSKLHRMVKRKLQL